MQFQFHVNNKEKSEQIMINERKKLVCCALLLPFLVYLPFDVLKIYCANICKVFFSSFL